MTPEDIESKKPKTFRYGYIAPGDVLYLPVGSIIIEKAVQADNVFVRVQIPLITDDLVDGALFLCSSTAELLGGEVFGNAVFGTVVR